MSCSLLQHGRPCSQCTTAKTTHRRRVLRCFWVSVCLIDVWRQSLGPVNDATPVIREDWRRARRVGLSHVVRQWIANTRGCSLAAKWLDHADDSVDRTDFIVPWLYWLLRVPVAVVSGRIDIVKPTSKQILIAAINTTNRVVFPAATYLKKPSAIFCQYYNKPQ